MKLAMIGSRTMDNKEIIFKGNGYEIHKKLTDCMPIYELFSIKSQRVNKSSYDYQLLLEEYREEIMRSICILQHINKDLYKEKIVALKKEEQNIWEEMQKSK